MTTDIGTTHQCSPFDWIKWISASLNTNYGDIAEYLLKTILGQENGDLAVSPQCSVEQVV